MRRIALCAAISFAAAGLMPVSAQASDRSDESKEYVPRSEYDQLKQAFEQQREDYDQLKKDVAQLKEAQQKSEAVSQQEPAKPA